MYRSPTTLDAVRGGDGIVSVDDVLRDGGGGSTAGSTLRADNLS